MTIGETSGVQSVSTTQTGSAAKGQPFDSEYNRLQKTSVFTLNENTQKASKSESSLVNSFKSFLKWNLTGGIAGSIVRGDLDEVIEGFKKETGFSNTDMVLGAISPAYGAFKLAANTFKSAAEDIYEDEYGNDDGFGEVSTNLDFES